MKVSDLVMVLAGFLAAPLSFAQNGLSATLTTEQVTCEELQLARLARRAVIEGHEASGLFLWRSSPAGGQFRGLGFRCWLCSESGLPGRFEQQLSFDLHFERALDRLSPLRPLISQASLTRRDASSNHVLEGSGFWSRLTVDLAPGVVNPFEPRLPLQIANRVGPQYAHADGAGRGIATDDLVAPCHGEVSELDERIFLILSRTMRIEELPVVGGLNINLFRGQEPLHYRVNVSGYGNSFDEDSGTFFYGSSGPVALELTFTQSDSGQLTTGTARVLPRCTGDLDSEPPGCTSQLTPNLKIYFLPPIVPGFETQGQEVLDAAPFLAFPETFTEPAVTETTIDWATLLANTAWN
jgi:hypothetical protein